MTGQQDIEIEKGDFLNRFHYFGHIRGFGDGVCGNGEVGIRFLELSTLRVGWKPWKK
jgi:hypothetical protein